MGSPIPKNSLVEESWGGKGVAFQRLAVARGLPKAAPRSSRLAFGAIGTSQRPPQSPQRCPLGPLGPPHVAGRLFIGFWAVWSPQKKTVFPYVFVPYVFFLHPNSGCNCATGEGLRPWLFEGSTLGGPGPMAKMPGSRSCGRRLFPTVSLVFRVLGDPRSLQGRWGTQGSSAT